MVAQKIVKLAAVQAAPCFLDKEKTVQKAVSIIEEAGRNGADVIGFPETWIPGFPYWTFGSAKWGDPDYMKAFARLQHNSIQVPGPETELLCAAAKRANAVVVMGINERDAQFSQGTLYNSQLIISNTGRVLGVHRKLHPTHAEKLIWGQGDGSTLHVFNTDYGRVGALVCWEHWMPLTNFTMHSKGEQIHVASWPQLPEMHQIASRHYAFVGKTFVICAGPMLSPSDIPDDFELKSVVETWGGELGDGNLVQSGSGIIGLDGNWIAGPVVGEEAIIYADVDLNQIAGEQQYLDVSGHYNRPDIFHLTVDDRPRNSVNWMSAKERPTSERESPDQASCDSETK